MDETWLTSSTFKAVKEKKVSDTSDSFWDQKWPIFAPKTVILANFEINEGISILFQYPKWMKLGLLHQLLRPSKKKTVSDTSDSFWGRKWSIFAPKTAILANFGINEGISILF